MTAVGGESGERLSPLLIIAKVGLYEFHYGAIDHLLAGMREVHGHIRTDDGLHLANTPVGLLRMFHKVAEGEIEQRGVACRGMGNELLTRAIL